MTIRSLRVSAAARKIMSTASPSITCDSTRIRVAWRFHRAELFFHLFQRRTRIGGHDASTVDHNRRRHDMQQDESRVVIAGEAAQANRKANSEGSENPSDVDRPNR